MLNHKNFATEAHNIRLELTSRVAHEVVDDVTLRNAVIENISKMPVQIHNIGSDKPLSDKENLDTRYLAAGKEILTNEKLNSADLGKGNAMFQEFRSLYYQLLMPVTLRNMLPNGLLGFFCVLMILMMISTDDSRIFSAAITLSQDVILPLRKKQLTPREHMWMIRWVAIGIGIFFFIGSSFMAQLDYIQLYVTLVATMWLGGCGPVIVFGLYSKKGNTAGAWASLVSGMILALSGALVQRNWAAVIYPWLEKYNWTDAIGSFLEAVSRPFNPYIVWKMNAIKYHS